MAKLEDIKKRQREVESKWNLETGLSLKEWLIEKLTEAEERASHHAEIASVCSATAERYAAALDSIAQHVAKERAETEFDGAINYGMRTLEAIEAIAKEARKEAE